MGFGALDSRRGSAVAKVSWIDRLIVSVAPQWGARRIRAREAVRYYEAADSGRRTSGWRRSGADANQANAPSLAALRDLSRDLFRNNGWAKRGVKIIANNTVGWGIMPNPEDRSRARGESAVRIWNEWADSTACDFDGRLSFYGLQKLVMQTVVLSGEALVVRQPGATKDGLPIPMRIQVLEPDYLDTTRNDSRKDGSKIINGVEIDRQGRRVAYWLFPSHPGSNSMSGASERVDADRVLHIFEVDRPQQVRGVPWLSAAVLRLKDYDDFEDAELMQQKVAACFGAFVTDMEASPSPLGIAERSSDGTEIDHLEPGHIAHLPPGKSITFAQPPSAQDSSFSVRALRRIAVSIGVPYADLSGDYSQANYSSSRMERLAHWQSVRDWQELMLIPQLCVGVWGWVMEMAQEIYGWPSRPKAQWAPPPMPILEPDKEGLAYERLVRIGGMTWPQMVREMGRDPVAQLDEIEAHNRELDRRGIILQTDPRRMSGAGQMQSPATSSPTEPTAPDLGQ